MPVERRLREGMHRNADGVEPDIDRLLTDVVRRGRRRVLLRRAVIAVSVAAVLIPTVTFGPGLLDAVRHIQRPVTGTRPTPTATRFQSLTGSYVGRVAEGSTAVHTHHLAGRWTIELHPDGTMSVKAPPAFSGVLSVVQFKVEGAQFRTNLFIQDVCSGLPLGTYRWSRSGHTLTFSAVDDPCAARVALLSSHSWTSTS